MVDEKIKSTIPMMRAMFQYLIKYLPIGETFNDMKMIIIDNPVINC